MAGRLSRVRALLRANKVLFKKREIFDTEQALKRGRMALVKRADAASLTELIEYLENYHGLIRDRVAAARAEDGLSLIHI